MWAGVLRGGGAGAEVEAGVGCGGGRWVEVTLRKRFTIHGVRSLRFCLRYVQYEPAFEHLMVSMPVAKDEIPVTAVIIAVY